MTGSDIFILFGTLGAAVVGYAALRGLALAFTQKHRLALAAKGEALLEAGHISDEHKSVVRFFLDRAFDGRGILLISIFFPVILLAIIVGLIAVRLRSDRMEEHIGHVSREVAEVVNLGLLSMAGASPFASTWLMAQLYAVSLFSKPVAKLRRMALTGKPAY